jgi:hypothetical protein
MRAPAGGTQGLPPRAGGSAPQAGQNQVVETPTGERAEVLSNAPIKPVYAEDVGQRDGMVAGSVVDEPKSSKEPPPNVDRWVVTKEAIFSHNGHRVRLPIGKVIDSLNYDVKRVLAQGVRLKKLEDGQDPADVLAEQYGNA